jgi:hypothetical protein
MSTTIDQILIPTPAHESTPGPSQAETVSVEPRARRTRRWPRARRRQPATAKPLFRAPGLGHDDALRITFR